MAFRRLPIGTKGLEQTVAPEGDDYHVVISKVEDKKSKKGADMDVLTIKILDCDGQYGSFRHYHVYPKAGDSEEQVAMAARNTRRLCTLFGVPYSDDGFDSDDLLNAEATGVRLSVEEFERDDGTVQEQNRLVLPRVDDGE